MKHCYPILVLLLVLPCWAEVSWDKVESKLDSKKPYSVTYKYQGPNGKYEFDYRFAGSKIRTEILSSKSDPSKRGTVIVYDRDWNADRIRAKTGGGLIIRSLTHKDVAGRPFHQSLFAMIAEQVSSLGKPTASSEGSLTKFQFGKGANGYVVVADSDGNVVRTERQVDRVKEVRGFSGLSWSKPSELGF
jgi:hypothetical protein